MNRDELQQAISQHIATCVAAISTDVAEYTAGQVKAAVVPPAVRQRGEPDTAAYASLSASQTVSGTPEGEGMHETAETLTGRSGDAT
jgi:hypothetical protein